MSFELAAVRFSPQYSLERRAITFMPRRPRTLPAEFVEPYPSTTAPRWSSVSVAMVGGAIAADLPRSEPVPPPAPLAVGKAPIGKLPFGKGPVVARY